MNTIDPETFSMNHLAHPLIPQHFATGGPHVDIHPGAMYESELDHHNGEDMWDAYMIGTSAKSPGEATSETSSSDTPIDGSISTIGMQVARDRDKELVSYFLFLRCLVLLLVQPVHSIAPSSNIDPITHHGATARIGSLSSTTDTDSADGMATPMRATASRATTGDPSFRNEMLVTTLPIEYESIQTIDDVGTINSDQESPDTGPTTSNVERGTDMEMDGGQLVSTTNEVQADRGPTIATGSSCNPVLPMEFEGDVSNLKGRLLAKGANREAVGQCDVVFVNGVTIEALEERMTREQSESLGVRDGKKFRLFLELVGKANGRVAERHRCCLCAPGKEYRNHRDALRHLLKDHFGLSFKCEWW